MNISKSELEYELGHLEEVKGIINDVINSKNVDIEDYKKHIVDRKRFIYEHKNEIIDADLNAMMNDEDFNVNLLNKDIVKVYKLYRSLETPYFSRIDFKTQSDTDTFYIGLTGVDKDFEPVVYDWRANVSNLYYNYGVGKSKYEIDGGVIEGETTLKRQFDIKMGVLKRVYDSELDSHDDLLEAVLSGNTTEQMKNIVSTIQREQNEIIRYNGSDALVVEGVAGSGKTSVALHRVAYLLYNQKGITNKNILIFSPSEVFTNYISNVLPELGEENVESTTFHDFASHYIKGKRIESIGEFIERYYEFDDRGDFKEIQEKLNGTCKQKIDEFLENYFKSKTFKKKIGLKKKFITAEELQTIKEKTSSKLSIKDRLLAMSEEVCAKFEIDETKNATKLEESLRAMLEIEDDPVKLYEEYANNSIGDYVRYEDIFGILYLYFEVMGYPSFSHIRFVVIDEAQDYTLWQFAFLKKVFNRATFTILGDKNQRINPYLKYESLEEITSIFKNSKYKFLKNTYRSSKEIIEYSNRLLGLDGINSIRPSNGIEVKTCENSDIDTVIREYKDMGFERIAIITKTKGEVSKLNSLIKENVTIIPVYLAKGLEYDAVIVYTDEKDPYTNDEMNVLYVACTRALHALCLCI